jgi:hypothetical protein
VLTCILFFIPDVDRRLSSFLFIMKISVIAFVAVSITLVTSRALPSDSSIDARNAKHGHHSAVAAAAAG